LPWIINEKLLFKNNKYLQYFDEFDREPKKIRYKHAWISLGIILGTITFFVLSFIPLSRVY
jgi:preprotein translocase subunit SecE